MGCDIHMITEIRGPHGYWVRAEPFFACDTCNGTGVHHCDYTTSGGKKFEERCYWCRGIGRTGGFRDRNYCLFGILADVRNGTGFAGCKTDEAFPSIAAGRGVPDDCSVYEDELGGDHSASWCTLAELLAYDWAQKAVRSGVVDAANFVKFQKDGKPDEWCGGISGPGIEMVSNEQMARDVKSVDLPGLVQYAAAYRPHTRVTWATETRAEVTGDFHSRFIPSLIKLRDDKGLTDSDVRIVFNFDN